MREMKDSGIAWLGDVDSRFEIKAIGNLFAIKKDIIGREPDQVLSITQKGIKIKDTTSNEGQNAASYAHYQIVNVGDFAMNHMDLLTGWVDISQFKGVTSPDYRVFSLTDNTQIPEYYLRVFQMYYTNRVFYAFGQGAANLGRWRLPRENFVKISIPCPPAELQRKIVEKIALQVSKIEALVANQQAQIEKLKQYKQSLITEVVTMGLDPNTAKKQVNIQNIKFIPAHWKLVKFKSVATLCNGKEVIAENGEIPVYGSGGVFKYTDRPIYTGVSLLMGRKGTIDNPMLVDGAFWTVDTMFYTSEIKNILPRFLYYACKGIIDYKYYKSGSVLPSMTQSELNNIYLTYPDEQEQSEIVAFLDDKCRMLDDIIRLKEKKIEKVTEYKKSLIYEYVTGKKEVV